LTYQIIDHIADLGIIVKGRDIENLFILAAQAMTDLMVRWPEEILYVFEGEHLI